MSENTATSFLKFSPFVSSVDPSLWHRLTQLKLDIDQLNENEHQLWGYYSNKSPQGLNNILSVDCTSFNKEPDESHNLAVGTVTNKNTIESFKDEDKAEIIRNEGRKLWKVIQNDAIECPTPSFITCDVIDGPKNVATVLNENQLNVLCNSYITTADIHKKNYFFLKATDSQLEFCTVKEGLKKIQSGGEWMFGFADSSSDINNPGWPLRNYLAFISYHCQDAVKKAIQVLCLRLNVLDGKWNVKNSTILKLHVNIDDSAWEKAAAGEGWVGWERNERGRMGPRFANLSSSMDPIKLAETSVDLNLKLMKWQLLPDLNLDIVKTTKCLLLGAGTLGCVVARNLMAWGVRHITFVDYGKVSYSNPVRQFLYKFSDFGALKAEKAAAALKEIFPGIISEGVAMSIPMPGHPVGDALLEETKKNVEKLSDLLDTHDVVFLLMDSRESRWLPTLMAAAKKKLVINAALGFDSYLVMRHGLKDPSPTTATSSSSSAPAPKLVTGAQLGCYFCNDVTAPGNSGRTRTLDQQCTVTRPGVSNVAGALAVELMISILQHPLQGLAPGESEVDSCESENILGILPHSIRGFLSEYRTILPATEAFSSCLACSSIVVQEYLTKGFEFILKALESKQYLEELSGLSKLLDESIVSEVLEYSSTDSDSDAQS